MLFFFFNDTATTEIYTLSLHDALPISASLRALPALKAGTLWAGIFIFSPIWGFLPSLALRSRTENFPKPVILTSSPPLSASVTTLSKAPEVPLGLVLGHPGLLGDPPYEFPLVHGGSFLRPSSAAAPVRPRPEI